MSILKNLRKSKNLSERELSGKLQMSRETLRQIENNLNASKISAIQCVANNYSYQVLVEIVPIAPPQSDFSSVVTSMKISRDGFDSWKLHLMNFVDEFRRSADMRLVLLPPVMDFDKRLKSLLASTVSALCAEIESAPPDWVFLDHYLNRPWFVAEMESLKASALQESPYHFRCNNIFTLANFLKRA